MKLKTIFTVLGQAFLQLADMAGTDAIGGETVNTEIKVMSGTDYIATLDKPDEGKSTPSAVFATGPAEAAASTPATPATVFAAEPELPTYTMTMKAGGITREAYHAANWTDDQLVEHSYMTVSGPKPAPVTAAVAAPPIAPVAPPPTSTPAAPAPVTQNGAPQAPAAPSPAAPPQDGEAGTAVQVDPVHALRDNGGKGIRWDARIHSSSREINEKDGMWRKKRGVDAAEVARVTSELLAVAPAPAVAAPPFVPLAPAAPPAASTSPTASATAGAAEPTTFADLCKWITSTGRTMPEAAAIAENYGMASLGVLAMPANAGIIPLVYADMNK